MISGSLAVTSPMELYEYLRSFRRLNKWRTITKPEPSRSYVRFPRRSCDNFLYSFKGAPSARRA